jgi:RHS repeat-associated protein
MTSSLLCTTASLSVLLAATSDSQAALAYTAFGHHLSASVPAGALAFNGERPQPLTGHYLLGNGYRAFNPTLMRFNSPDSWSPFGDGGLNAYAYCAGDPINNIDPDGHLSRWGRLAGALDFIAELKFRRRADVVARDALGIGAAPVRAASPAPGPSAAPESPKTQRRRLNLEAVRRYQVTAPGRRVRLKATQRYQAKFRDRIQAFKAEEATGIYDTKISTKDFTSLTVRARAQAFDKAKTLYKFERQPSVDQPVFTADKRLDVHHFDLAIATLLPKGSSVLLAARHRRMEYIQKHVSAVRTGE